MLALIVIVVLVLVGILIVAGRRSGASSQGATASSERSARSSGRACPACGEGLPADAQSRNRHLSRHTRQITQDGQVGFLWECRDACGHSDRFYPTPSGAAIAMSAHLMQRHAIMPS